MNTIVEEWLQLLPGDLREEYEERAAIMVHDGGVQPEELAQALALLCVLKRHQAALLPSYVEGKINRKGDHQ